MHVLPLIVPLYIHWHMHPPIQMLWVGRPAHPFVVGGGWVFRKVRSRLRVVGWCTFMYNNPRLSPHLLCVCGRMGWQSFWQQKHESAHALIPWFLLTPNYSFPSLHASLLFFSNVVLPGYIQSHTPALPILINPSSPAHTYPIIFHSVLFSPMIFHNNTPLPFLPLPPTARQASLIQQPSSN